MTETAANYTPIDLQKRYRQQAIGVWIWTLGFVLFWVGLIVAAPLVSNISSPIYTFFSYVCHQIPERTLHISGHPMAVCSRCFGVYFGLLAGIVLYPFWRALDETEAVPRFWLFLSLIPITIDWSLTVFGIWENTHWTRFLTGLILGIACSIYIVPALVEVARNLTSGRRRSQ